MENEIKLCFITFSARLARLLLKCKYDKVVGDRKKQLHTITYRYGLKITVQTSNDKLRPQQVKPQDHLYC